MPDSIFAHDLAPFAEVSYVNLLPLLQLPRRGRALVQRLPERAADGGHKKLPDAPEKGEKEHRISKKKSHVEVSTRPAGNQAGEQTRSEETRPENGPNGEPLPLPEPGPGSDLPWFLHHEARIEEESVQGLRMYRFRLALEHEKYGRVFVEFMSETPDFRKITVRMKVSESLKEEMQAQTEFWRKTLFRAGIESLQVESVRDSVDRSA